MRTYLPNLIILFNVIGTTLYFYPMLRTLKQLILIRFINTKCKLTKQVLIKSKPEQKTHNYSDNLFTYRYEIFPLRIVFFYSHKNTCLYIKITFKFQLFTQTLQIICYNCSTSKVILPFFNENTLVM